MFNGRIANALTPAVGALAFIFLWWFIVWLKVIDPILLPSPQASAKAIWDGFVGGPCDQGVGRSRYAEEMRRKSC